MKSLLSLLLLAAAGIAVSGCDTCYTEGYRPLYNARGFRGDGMTDDPRLMVYKLDDLRFHPANENPDILRPTLGVNTHYLPPPPPQ